MLRSPATIAITRGPYIHPHPHCSGSRGGGLFSSLVSDVVHAAVYSLGWHASDTLAQQFGPTVLILLLMVAGVALVWLYIRSRRRNS